MNLTKFMGYPSIEKDSLGRGGFTGIYMSHDPDVPVTVKRSCPCHVVISSRQLINLETKRRKCLICFCHAVDFICPAFGSPAKVAAHLARNLTAFDQIIECNQRGQPVLVGTVSVEKSEVISKVLAKRNIAHAVLNAKQYGREADVVAQANRVLGTIHEARAEGAYRSAMLICSASSQCDNFRGPSTGLILVADHNNNLRLDNGDTLLEELLMPEGMTIEWRSFRMKPWLRINRFGVAYYQNGHFLLCYRGQARKVVLNYQAKARVQREPADPARCP